MADQHIDLDLSTVEQPQAHIRMPLNDNQKARIKKGEQNVEGDTVILTSPSLQSLIRLGTMMKKWKKVSSDRKNEKGGTLNAEETLDLVEEFINNIEAIIPAIKGYELSIDNLMSVVTVAMGLAKPAQLKELERRGISVNTHKKKATISSVR